MTQPRMNPDDIPVSVTQLVYTAPKLGAIGGIPVAISQNQVAEQLAHFWPAIEQHIRDQVAADLEAVDPADWAVAGQHAGTDAAAIARNGRKDA